MAQIIVTHPNPPDPKRKNLPFNPAGTWLRGWLLLLENELVAGLCCG